MAKPVGDRYLNSLEIAKLRGLTNRLGTTDAADRVGVHKHSLIRALAGLDLRPNTLRQLRRALGKDLDLND